MVINLSIGYRCIFLSGVPIEAQEPVFSQTFWEWWKWSTRERPMEGTSWWRLLFTAP